MNRNIQRSLVSENKIFCNIIHYTNQKRGVSIMFFLEGGGGEIIEINNFI